MKRVILIFLLLTGIGFSQSLTGASPASTYGDLMHISHSNLGIDSTLRTIYDGVGNASALKISKINATLNNYNIITANDTSVFNSKALTTAQLAYKAPLASPTFTGSVSLPGVTYSLTTKTSDYTATTSDYTILCNAASAPITITLPAASSNTGRTYVIKKIDSSVNTVTVDGNASETIDGSTTYTIRLQYESIMIQSNGSNWNIL